jgi:hypothetical protein
MEVSHLLLFKLSLPFILEILCKAIFLRLLRLTAAFPFCYYRHPCYRLRQDTSATGFLFPDAPLNMDWY